MHGMTEPLKVIALISGGKDSFFSLLHCIQNGHKVVALGNLYPAAEKPASGSERGSNHAPPNENDEHDLDESEAEGLATEFIPRYDSDEESAPPND